MSRAESAVTDDDGARTGTCRHLLAAITVVLLITSLSHASPRADETVDQLKARVASTNLPDRPHLCIQIAEKQLNESDKLYAAADVEKAQAALTDVVAYSELARDYAVQTHKYQKQSEIAVRRMSRKLTEILHALGHEDQGPVKEAVDRLQKISDDLLASMFKKAGR